MDLSIIIPTFNRLWCLPETIESCRGTKCHTEIIIIDDGSDDGTLEWLNQQEDVIVLKQAHLGKCWAVNKGFDIAKGKYIRFLDSDDLVDKLANDEQFELAELTNSDVVVSGYQVFNNEKQIINKQTWIETDDFIAQQLGECDSSHYSAYLFRKKFIECIPHRPDYALRDDRLFVLEAAMKNPKISVHPGTALFHRVQHADRLQLTQGLIHCIQNFQHVNIYKHILNQLKIEDRLTKRRINASIKVLWPLAHWIAKYHPADAEQLAQWIYELDPQFDIPEKGLLGMMYKNIGFRRTEQLLHFRRVIKK